MRECHIDLHAFDYNRFTYVIVWALYPGMCFNHALRILCTFNNYRIKSVSPYLAVRVILVCTMRTNKTYLCQHVLRKPLVYFPGDRKQVFVETVCRYGTWTSLVEILVGYKVVHAKNDYIFADVFGTLRQCGRNGT